MNKMLIMCMAVLISCLSFQAFTHAKGMSQEEALESHQELVAFGLSPLEFQTWFNDECMMVVANRDLQKNPDGSFKTTKDGKIEVKYNTATLILLNDLDMNKTIVDEDGFYYNIVTNEKKSIASFNMEPFKIIEVLGKFQFIASAQSQAFDGTDGNPTYKTVFEDSIKWLSEYCSKK